MRKASLVAGAVALVVVALAAFLAKSSFKMDWRELTIEGFPAGVRAGGKEGRLGPGTREGETWTWSSHDLSLSHRTLIGCRVEYRGWPLARGLSYQELYARTFETPWRDPHPEDPETVRRCTLKQLMSKLGQGSVEWSPQAWTTRRCLVTYRSTPEQPCSHEFGIGGKGEAIESFWLKW